MIRATILLKILILISMTTISCKHEGTEIDRKKISEVWKSYYGNELNNKEKILLLTSEFKTNYMQNIDHALFSTESELEKLNFKNQLNILGKRAQIDSLGLKPSDINTFEKAFDKIEITNSFLIDTKNKLSRVEFKNKNEAYGFFNLLFSDKSNQFLKEKDTWKINPTKEHIDQMPARQNLMRVYIEKYGSEKAAISELIETGTGQAAIWNPLYSK